MTNEKREMPKRLKEYITFKMMQYARITKNEFSNEEFYRKALQENMKKWIQEAISAGL